MLRLIRAKATGWIAGTIISLLIISFAFWGVSFYFGQNGVANVAMVNDTAIDMQTYQRAFIDLRRKMQSIFGGELSLEEEEMIRKQALEYLLDAEVINQIVAENNLRVTDKQLAATITNLEMFRDEKGFDRYKYERSIANMGMQPTYFEQQLRMELLSEQLQAGLAETVFVTDAELDRVLRMKDQTRDITYAMLSIDDYIDNVELADSEIWDYYDKHKESYSKPEQIKIAYIDLDVKKLAEQIEFSAEELRSYYQDNKDIYSVGEQRSVTRLFIKMSKEATEEEVATKRAIMDKALQMSREGKAFEDIVKAFTDEGTGALQFSEHAFMTRGIMGDEIDDFLFKNAEGSISGIIETESGLSIVKVGQIRGGSENVFENVAGQVENDYRQTQAELQFFELSDQLTTLAFEHPYSLEMAAEATGLTIEKSGFFSRNNKNDDITSNSLIISSGFGQELIDSGQNSDAIELGDNHIAVIRVLEHKPASVRPFENVRTKVVADLKHELAARKLQEFGEKIIGQIEAGIDPEHVTSEMEINWNKEVAVKRDASTVTRSVLRTAFQMARPENGPVTHGYSLGSGDYAIIVLTSVEDGNIEEVAETESKAAYNDILRIQSADEWREFLENARANAKIRIFEENI